MEHQICENIKTLRKRHQLTQKDMAAKLNIAERTYQRFENGERKTLDLALLQRVCDVLRASPAEILDPQ